jgi:hypothetical protein
MKNEKGQHGEPWRSVMSCEADNDYIVIYDILDCNFNEILSTNRYDAEKDDYKVSKRMDRAAECVNALDGMNPADVAKMKDYIKDLESAIKSQCYYKKHCPFCNGEYAGDGKFDHDEICIMRRIREATQ